MPGVVWLRSPTDYVTTFGKTENPISESGRWINGGTTGLDWRDIRTTPGLAFGTAPSASPPYDDPTAVLTGTWGPVQTVEATVQITALSGVNQEVELRTLTTITANRIVGYEALFSITSNPYVEIMRWDGGTTLPDFFSVTGGPVSGAQQLATGNRVKMTVSAAGLLSAFVDYGSGYVLICSGTDTTYQTGSPGMGFFQHAGPAGPLSGYGFTSFHASATT